MSGLNVAAFRVEFSGESPQENRERADRRKAMGVSDCKQPAARLAIAHCVLGHYSRAGYVVGIPACV